MELAEAPSIIHIIHKAVLEGLPRSEAPVEHRFTPGLYTRIITMAAGQVIVTKIHKTQHPFFILKGHCSVMDQNGDWIELRGGDHGITEPGTQRVLRIHEETVWATTHVTTLTDLAQIESEIVEIPENPLLDKDHPYITALGEWSDAPKLEEAST